MTDVVVVGAGVAGLAAAGALRRAGVACEVLEAGGRIGGRAFTDHPAALAGAPFDHGASWLHAAERNPIAAIARAAGDALVESDPDRQRWVNVDGHRASAEDLAEYDAAWERYTEVAAARTQQEPDTSVGEAVASLRGDPWTANVEVVEATLIAAADPWDFSVRDWHLNQLHGSNLGVPGGVGALVARRLGPAAGAVRLNTPVRRIEWGDGVAVVTDAGTLAARACIVTVSAGVLAAGGIAFAPELPAAQREAIAGLPMGLLTKVGLRVTDAKRLGVAPRTWLSRRVARPGEPVMSFGVRPLGEDYVAGFVGGPTAWELSRAGDAATEAFAREQFAKILGADAAAALGGAVVSGWGHDPLYVGAYAYARPGCMPARAAMDAPLGSLIFAGEAWCMDGLAGTVGGAFLSGERAAALAGHLA